MRYDRDHFPEDLMLQETADRQNFQGRYVLRHPYPEPATCDTGVSYRNGLPRTFETQARNLVELTGWELDSIRQRMRETGQQICRTPAGPGTPASRLRASGGSGAPSEAAAPPGDFQAVH